MSNKKEAYLCVSAMLRAREPKLLNNEKAERMLDAASYDDAAKLLTDCGYPDMSQMSASEVEECLAKRRSDIFDELGKMSPDSALVDIFKLKYDYHNAKTIIKAEAMGTDAKRLLSDSGRIPGLKLQEIYNEDKRILLPEKLANAMAEAKSVLARTSNPQLSDFLLDRAYFAELSGTAEDSGNEFLKGYAKILIDTANLKGIIRTLRMGKSRDFLEDVLVPGGKVHIREILSADSTEKILALYSRTGMEKICEAAEQAVSGGRLTEFEKACDNAVNSYIRLTRHVTYGSEPVAAYLASVENETTAVRMILTGKLAGIKSEILRERLRDLYA